MKVLLLKKTGWKSRYIRVKERMQGWFIDRDIHGHFTKYDLFGEIIRGE